MRKVKHGEVIKNLPIIPKLAEWVEIVIKIGPV